MSHVGAARRNIIKGFDRFPVFRASRGLEGADIVRVEDFRLVRVSPESSNHKSHACITQRNGRSYVLREIHVEQSTGDRTMIVGRFASWLNRPAQPPDKIATGDKMPQVSGS